MNQNQYITLRYQRGTGFVLDYHNENFLEVIKKNQAFNQSDILIDCISKPKNTLIYSVTIRL